MPPAFTYSPYCGTTESIKDYFCIVNNILEKGIIGKIGGCFFGTALPQVKDCFSANYNAKINDNRIKIA